MTDTQVVAIIAAILFSRPRIQSADPCAAAIDDAKRLAAELGLNPK